MKDYVKDENNTIMKINYFKMHHFDKLIIHLIK